MDKRKVKLNDKIDDIEFTLKDILLLFKKYRGRLLIFPILVTGLTLILITKMPDYWTATSVIQVGEIATASQDEFDTSVAREVETNDQTLVRIRNMPTNLGGIVSNKDELKASILPDTQLVEIKITEKSIELAQEVMQKLIAKLMNEHNKLFEANIRKFQLQLSTLTEKMNLIKEEKGIFLSKMKEGGKDLGLFLINNKLVDLELHALEKTTWIITQQLNSEKTFRTHLIGGVTISQVNKSVKKISIVLLAFIIGIAGSIVIAFFHKSYSELE